MESRAPGQKEYELAFELLEKPKPTDADFVNSINNLKSAITQQYIPAVQFLVRLFLKKTGFNPQIFPEDKKGNAFFKKIIKNERACEELLVFPLEKKMKTLMALQVPDEKRFSSFISILLHQAASGPDGDPYAQCIIAGGYHSAGTFEEREQYLRLASLAGLPLAQYSYALLILTGDADGPNELDLYSDKIGPMLREHTMPLSKFLAMPLTSPKKEFGFDEALETLVSPPAPLAELAGPIAEASMVGVDLNSPACLLINCIFTMEKNPEAALSAFGMLRRSAVDGNIHALRMMSFLILRTAKDFSVENPIKIEVDGKVSTFLQENTRRDKAALKLLENVGVREILKASFNNEYCIKLAINILEPRITSMPEALGAVKELGLDEEKPLTTQEAKAAGLSMCYQDYLTKMNGLFLLYAKSNQSKAEKEYADQQIDKLILNAPGIVLYALMISFIDGELLPKNLWRAYCIAKTLNSSTITSPKYLYAYICNKVAGIKMSDELSALNTAKRYQLERDLADSMLIDSKLIEKIKLDLEPKTKPIMEAKSLVKDDGSKECLSALEMLTKLAEEITRINKMSAAGVKMLDLRMKVIFGLLEKSIEKNFIPAKYALAVNLIRYKKGNEVRAFNLILSAAAAATEDSIPSQRILDKMLECKNDGKFDSSFEEKENRLVSCLTASKEVMKLFDRYLEEKAKKQDMQALQSASMPLAKSPAAEEKKSAVKEKAFPTPKFKSQFFANLSSKKVKVDTGKILSQDPFFLVKVVHGLVYKKLEISDVALADIKAHAATLASCEHNAEFWRLLHEGFMYGKGKNFIHKLRELGFASYVFGECKEQDLDYIESRAEQFDVTLASNKRPLLFDGKHVSTDVLYALLVEKELARDELITAEAVKAAMEKLKFPVTELSALLLAKVKAERDRKDIFLAATVKKATIA